MFRKRPPAVSATGPGAGRPATAQRRWVRAPVDLAVRYTLAGSPEPHAGRIDNLSGGGVRLETNEDIAAGTAVELAFEVAGAPVACSARIVMSLFESTRKRFLHGVAFTAIEPAAQETIVRHVAVLQRAE
ncbi:MAG: PilZ domain-containing protein [Candidatus Velthaea sp.]